jgi:hypothetical protein
VNFASITIAQQMHSTIAKNGTIRGAIAQFKTGTMAGLTNKKNGF